MAPSATSHNSPQEASGNSMENESDGQMMGSNEAPSNDPSQLYTDAYTHGYTDGYIKGYLQPEGPAQMPIAIVGMSCRLPGNVATPDQFWELCSRARTGWSEIPKERFNNASFHHPNPGKVGCFNAAGGNFLKEDLGLFDAPFFSLTAQEATSMDPQQRILLECTFEALDSAGIPKHDIIGKNMGVFIGGSFSEYESQSFADSDTIPMYQSTGCAFAMQSNRISHFFDLRGPSFTMDTACSSSLVALHQACQSLRTRESQSAIVGGCHLNMLPEFFCSFSNSRLFSDEGRSFSFDSRGTGYGRGEGCGMMILKPLEDALRDNDVIRSVIVASGINQDGKTPGITMPNGDAQESLMRSVYKSASINPKDTGYIEAHGTGTKVGDPIEVTALRNVFGEGRNARNPLFVGSVKSNIGHLEAASGIVAVIKTALMLERGFILPNYDFKKPNEKIPFAKWHLKVPITQRPWPQGKRFASVNNFGFGGTNSHVVLEKAPYIAQNSPELSDLVVQNKKLFVLSANDKRALEGMMKNVGIYLEQRPEVFQSDLMSNVAYTLGQRRSLLQWRVAIPASSSFDLIQALNSGKVSPAKEMKPLRIGFVFTGQGAQCARMGWELYQQYPVFRSTLVSCDRYLSSLGASFSLIDELEKDTETTLVNEAHISQPICTAIQLALTDLLHAWGVSPIAVTGHSSGEIGAAYAAGILSLESSMAIAYYRGLVTTLLKKKFPSLQGSMMAVGCTKDEIAPLIAQLKAKEVRIACYNSPSSLTISGDEPAIDELHHIMDKLQMFNRKLQVEMAYHSHHMELVARDYKGCLEGLEAPKATEVKFYSSLHGRLADGTELGAQYWVDNLTQSVRFSEALTDMCQPTDEHKTGVNLLIEIGPHSALAGPIKQILKACGTDASKIAYTSALVRKKDAVDTALDLASTLFNKGLNLDLGAINLNSPSKAPTLLIDMPRYPWNHQTKYWHEPRLMQKHKSRTAPRHDLLGTLANYSNDLEPTRRNILRIDDLAWLRHHQIQSLTLFPMSGFISMAVEAMSQRVALRDTHYDDFEIRNISVNTPLMVTDIDIEMTLQLRPHQEGTLSSSDVWEEFRIHSWAANKGWTEHCKGLIRVKSADPSEFTQSFVSATEGSEKASVSKDTIYNSLSELGVSYGPSFQGLVDCQASNSSSVANIVVGDTASCMPLGYQTKSIIHPALLEQLIEMYWPILGAGRISMDTVYLPSSIKRMSISRNVSELTKSPGDALRAYCTGEVPLSHPRPIQMSMLATTLEDANSSLIMIENLTIAPVIEGRMSTESEAHRELCYKLDWEPILEPLNTAPNGSVAHLNGTTTGAVNHANGTSHVVSEWPQGDIVIIHGNSVTQRSLSTKLAYTVELETGNAPIAGTLSDVDTNGKLCLFLPEIDETLLSLLTAEQFTQLQKALTNVQGILWIVRGAYGHSSRPDVNMVSGLSRSIRSETLLKFATLDLDAQQILSPDSTVRAICETFKATFGSKATADCELEFMERNGALFTPRIIDNAPINEYVHKHTTSSIIESTTFLQKDRPLRMAIKTPGVFDTLHFVDQSLEETIRDDEIEIEVKAIGMNARDVTTAMGHFNHFNFGSECSGVVTKVGSSVGRLQIGDRVACISTSGGVYSSYSRTKHDFAFKIKDEMSFEAAASLPVAYCTAQYGLVNLAGVEEADTILINGAMMAVGQACLNLAQAEEVKVFAVVESIEDKETLVKSFGLSEDHIFTSHTEACTLVNKGRFDIILNCTPVDADAIRTLWAGLSNFGRFIELGGTRARLEMGSMDNNKSFMSADLMDLAIQRPKLLSRLVSSISNLVQNGTSKPLPATIFPISDIETAFKTMQPGNIPGKIVVVPRPGDEVKATPSSKQNQLLRPDSTYILIGGTGGLGCSMARWMSNKGARNLVLVSRSGSITGKVKELIDELALDNNTNVVVRPCDVSDEKAVERLIREDLADMPAIRGVIHGAMVLNDVLFEKMTFEQYTTVTESKVKGAWNFHNTLIATKADLDFFVAISSAAGAVGNRGQAAYSAANTFLNAFVQHRLSLSLPASSIDLTAVSDAGYLAENAEAAAEVSRNLGSDTICKAEVLALLSAAIDGTLARECNSHIITGMRITTPPPFWTNDAKFKHLRIAAEAVAASSASVATVSFNTQLKAAKSLSEAEDVVRRGLCAKLPSVLMLEEEDMDVTRSLSNYALDSLVAIEVRNYITREFEANLQVLELLSSGSIETLAKAICVKSKLVSFDA